MPIHTPAGRMHEFGDPVNETSMKNHLCRMSSPLANTPSPVRRPLAEPPKRAEAADVIAAVAWGRHVEGEGRDIAWSDYDAASQAPAGTLCSFLDCREPLKRYARYHVGL